VAIKHVQNSAPPLESLRPDLPPEMCTLVHRMMAKKPEERFENCKEILRELSKIREQYATGTTPTPSLSLPGGALDPTTVTAQATSAFDELPAVAYRRPASSGWLKWVIAGLVFVGMFVGGMVVRTVKNRVANAGVNPAQANPSPAQMPLVSKDEKFAIDAATHFSDPDGKDPSELKRGLQAQFDLGVYYLKQRRLDDAEKFFRSLTDPSRAYRKLQRPGEHPYRITGQFGLALVNGYRDQARDAQDALERLLADQQPPGSAISLKDLPIAVESLDLRKIVADVLNRNAANLKVDRFTAKPALEQLRRPPVAFGKPERPFRFK
jgi:serine/threonine-protein kinase